MKYCKKCRKMYNDGESVCTQCKKELLTIEDETTPVYMLTASGFELQRVKTALLDNGVPCDTVTRKYITSAKAVTGYDSDAYDLVVPYSAYEKAYDICVGIGAIDEGKAEILDASAEAEEFEEMPQKKRTAVRIISALLLILLFAAVIYGTDFITGLIKGLF